MLRITFWNFWGLVPVMWTEWCLSWASSSCTFQMVPAIAITWEPQSTLTENSLTEPCQPNDCAKSLSLRAVCYVAIGNWTGIKWRVERGSSDISATLKNSYFSAFLSLHHHHPSFRNCAWHTVPYKPCMLTNCSVCVSFLNSKDAWRAGPCLIWFLLSSALKDSPSCSRGSVLENNS